MATITIIPSIFIIFSIIHGAVLCDATDSPFVDFVKETISSHQIVMFSKSYCPYCFKAKKVFEELNVEPYVLELDKIEYGPEIQTAMGEVAGQRFVPQVFINGKHIGGSAETVAAYNNGELAKLIESDSSGITIADL